MPKGRVHAPPTVRDGVWFPHRGMGTCKWPPQRDPHTTTGEMITAPFKEFTAAYPPQPPKPYGEKHTQRNFKLSNNFSAHDNRHSFQDHGVYFADGRQARNLGKRLESADSRQHFTNKDYLKHMGRHYTNYDYNTNYSKSYDTVENVEEPKHRRFPKVHAEGRAENKKLSTRTTSWYDESDCHKTPLQVLATSQEPFLGPNKWKYSNHGLDKCYPPYDRVDKSNPYSKWIVQGPSILKGECN